MVVVVILSGSAGSTKGFVRSVFTGAGDDVGGDTDRRGEQPPDTLDRAADTVCEGHTALDGSTRAVPEGVSGRSAECADRVDVELVVVEIHTDVELAVGRHPPVVGPLTAYRPDVTPVTGLGWPLDGVLCDGHRPRVGRELRHTPRAVTHTAGTGAVEVLRLPATRTRHTARPLVCRSTLLTDLLEEVQAGTTLPTLAVRGEIGHICRYVTPVYNHVDR